MLLSKSRAGASPCRDYFLSTRSTFPKFKFLSPIRINSAQQVLSYHATIRTLGVTGVQNTIQKIQMLTDVLGIHSRKWV